MPTLFACRKGKKGWGLRTRARSLVPVNAELVNQLENVSVSASGSRDDKITKTISMHHFGLNLEVDSTIPSWVRKAKSELGHFATENIYLCRDLPSLLDRMEFHCQLNLIVQPSLLLLTFQQRYLAPAMKRIGASKTLSGSTILFGAVGVRTNCRWIQRQNYCSAGRFCRSTR